MLCGIYETSKTALAWAKEKNGELPTCVEQALLFANAADKFQKDWYWSSELYGGGAPYARCQYFGYGCQYCQYHSGKADELRARAVRRVAI